jgi:hypothetical protein
MNEQNPSLPLGADGRTYQQYFDERKMLADGERAAAEGFDKTLLTLSAGGIALSVTFVEKLGAAGTFKPVLYASWIMLVGALLLNIRAFMKRQTGFKQSTLMNDERFRNGRTLLANPFGKRAETFNEVAYWFFVAGILLLLLFAGLNYQHGRT